MTARTVTGNIQQVTGAASPGGFFVVTPENPLRAADSDSLMIGESFRVTADGSGDISFVVEEGTYQITATTAAGDFRVRMVVDSEGPWTIGRLVGLPVPITPGLAQQVFDAADAAAASAAQAALYDGKKVDTFAELDALTAAEIDVGDLVRQIDSQTVYERVSSGADWTTDGGIGLRVLKYRGAVSLSDWPVVADWSDAEQTGTDNQAAIASAVAGLNAGDYNTLIIPEGRFYHSAVIPPITRIGVEMTGAGGLTRLTRLVCGALSGPQLHIQQRRPLISGINFQSTTARRNAGNPTTTGGITDGHGILIGRDELNSIVSTTRLDDVLVEGQPTDGVVCASSVEMSKWNTVWAIDCVRHGFVWGSGKDVAGFTNDTTMSFAAVFENLRAFECGGHSFYAPSRASDNFPVQMLQFINPQSLGCLWKRSNDQSGDLFQSAIGGNGHTYIDPQYEDQQYAQSTTAAGRSRVANATPSRAATATARSSYISPYFSSLIEGILVAVTAVQIFQPRSFRGTYDIKMTKVVRASSLATGFKLDLTRELQSGDAGDPGGLHPAPVQNQSLSADIRIDGVPQFPTSLTTHDIAITRTPVDAQIVGGAIPQATVTATTLRVLERDRTPTGADAVTSMFANASMDGVQIDLIAGADTDITINDGGGSGASNKGFVLGANRVLTGNKRLRVEYKHDLDKYFQVAFFE